MKIWWLLGILALILLFSGFREGFERRGGGGGSSSAPPPMAVTQEAPTEEYATPTCPAGTTLDVRKKCIYPDEPEMFICPSGYITTGSRTCRKQGSTEEIPPQCSAGKVFDSERGGCVKPDAPGTCPAGYTLRVTASSNTCVRPVATSGGTTGGTTGGTGMSQNTTVSTTTGNTTGGSSTSSFGPNSGGGGNRRNQVFGPLSGGRGEGSGFVPSDSSKTTQYPEIMGGGDNRPSTRIDGAGIVAPSKNWQLSMDGSLPSDASLGNMENSRFLPFSRQPGDMDLIPDPYRVSQQFSSASYSFKTEPTPFLTDFSAFQS